MHIILWIGPDWNKGCPRLGHHIQTNYKKFNKITLPFQEKIVVMGILVDPWWFTKGNMIRRCTKELHIKLDWSVLALIRVEWAYPEFTQKWQNSCHGLQRIWKLKWKEFDFWFSLTVLLIDQTLNKGCEFTGLRIPAIFAVFLYQTNAHIFVGLNK